MSAAKEHAHNPYRTPKWIATMISVMMQKMTRNMGQPRINERDFFSETLLVGIGKFLVLSIRKIN